MKTKKEETPEQRKLRMVESAIDVRMRTAKDEIKSLTKFLNRNRIGSDSIDYNIRLKQHQSYLQALDEIKVCYFKKPNR